MSGYLVDQLYITVRPLGVASYGTPAHARRRSRIRKLSSTTIETDGKTMRAHTAAAAAHLAHRFHVARPPASFPLSPSSIWASGKKFVMLAGWLAGWLGGRSPTQSTTTPSVRPTDSTFRRHDENGLAQHCALTHMHTQAHARTCTCSARVCVSGVRDRTGFGSSKFSTEGGFQG